MQRRSQLFTRSWLAALAFAGLIPSLLGAQATGSIRGRITNAAAGVPLANAQVGVAGTTLGAQTNSEGIYQIAGVPAGSHVVRVRLIGYAPTEKPTTVTAGGIATLDFSISQRPCPR